MKYHELEELKPYRVTKDSSDGTFHIGEIIWVSSNKNINSAHAGGWISPAEVELKTLDFEAEPACDWIVFSDAKHEVCTMRS